MLCCFNGRGGIFIDGVKGAAAGMAIGYAASRIMGAMSQDGAGDYEQREMTPEEYEAELRDRFGAERGTVSDAENAAIDAAMADSDVRKGLNDLFQNDVSNGTESAVGRVYRNSDGSHVLSVDQGVSCGNTCMTDLPAIDTSGGKTAVFEFHVHPKGGRLPSPADYGSSASNNLPGVIWARNRTLFRGVQPREIRYRGNKIPRS